MPVVAMTIAGRWAPVLDSLSLAQGSSIPRRQASLKRAPANLDLQGCLLRPRTHHRGAAHGRSFRHSHVELKTAKTTWSRIQLQGKGRLYIGPELIPDQP